MQRIFVSLLLTLIVGAARAESPKIEKVATPPELVVHTITGSDYASVRESLELAITNRGLVVDHVSHIGDMLARTGKDLGATKQVYAQAESLQFCSANISRATMEANPNNIAFCPYIVFVYALPKEPKKVYIGYRRPPHDGSAASNKALKQVEDLLEGIVKDTTSW